jgi:phospholipid/cholesterol/gamma-HCH transport system substrate-binding protein
MVPDHGWCVRFLTIMRIMKTHAQNIRLGIFIAVSLAILLLMVGFFTTQQFLRQEDIYYVAYHDVSVSGLEVGSQVKYLGIKVGVIRDISIDSRDVNRIVVKLALNSGTPIKEDAVANITALGITGLKTIEIGGGSNEAPFLKPEGYIRPGTSVTGEITGKAEVIAEKMESVLNNLQTFTRPENLDKITILVERLTEAAEKANASLSEVDRVLAENRPELKATLLAARSATERLNETSLVLHATVGRVNQLVMSDTLGDILGNAREVSEALRKADLQGLIGELGAAARQTSDLLLLLGEDLNRNSRELSGTLSTLRITLENLEEASRVINRDPSVLLRGVRYKDTPDKMLRHDQD